MVMPSSRSLSRLIVLMACLIAAPSFSQDSQDSQDAEAQAAEGKDAKEEEEEPIGYLEYSLGVSVVPTQSLTGADATGWGYSGQFKSDARTRAEFLS